VTAHAKKFVPSQPRAHLLRRIRRSAFTLIPIAVWVLGIAGVIWLADHKARPLDYPGLAVIARHTAVAPSQGMLETLLVNKHSKVTTGQLIGRLDGSHLELRARQVKIRIAEIRAAMVRERALLDHAAERELDRADQDRLNEMRRFQRDVENAKLNSLEVLASLEESRVRLEGLRIELEREKDLSDKELFSEAEVIRTRTRFDALAKRIEQTESILASRNKKLVAVEARWVDYQKSRDISKADLEKVLGTFQFRIQAEDLDLESIALERTRLDLRAPASGFVSVVHVEHGQLVTQGRPVITIVAPHPDAMIAFVPPGEIKYVKVGMAAALERSTNPGATIRSKVVALGPTVQAIPKQLLMIPSVPEWGVPVYLQVTDEMSSMPGEAVRVRIFVDASGG
jgi:multidrug resistance efflux pump